MPIAPLRPTAGLGVTLLGEAQAQDHELQDADLTQPGILLRSPGSRELPARKHVAGGTQDALDQDDAQALFWRPDVEGDELCMVHGDTLYASAPTEDTANGRQAWKEVGSWAPWRLRQYEFRQDQFEVKDLDMATIVSPDTGDTYHVLTWQRTSSTGFGGVGAAPGVYAAVSSANGAEIVGPVLLDSSGRSPRAVAADSYVVITWWNSASVEYRFATWELSDPALIANRGLLITGLVSALQIHDMRKDPDNDAVIFMSPAPSVPSIGFRRVTTAGQAFLASLGTTVVPSAAVSMDRDPAGGWLVTWSDGTDVETVHVDDTFTADTTAATDTPGGTIRRATGCHRDGVASQGVIALEIAGSSGWRNSIEVLEYDGSSLSSIREQKGASIWGHAVVFQGRHAGWVKHFAANPDTSPATFSGATWILTDYLTGDVLARAFPERGDDFDAAGRGGGTVGIEQPTTPHTVDGVLWQVAAPMDPTEDFHVIAGISVDGSSQARAAATVPGYVLDAHAGYPVVYDGAEAVEADWHVTPVIAVASSDTGGSMTDESTYVVAATYLWTDRLGRWWRSSPSIVSHDLATGEDEINLTIQTCRWTARSRVVIEIWRSLADAGSPLYLERRIENDPDSDSASTSVTRSDSSVSGGETLDQAEPSGVLPHGTAQVTDFMSFDLGRFWSAHPQRPDVIVHSIDHDVSRDGFGWGWEETQLVQLNTSDRPRTARELEGGIAILTGSDCHLLRGLGPSVTGAGIFGGPDRFAVVDIDTAHHLTAKVPDAMGPAGIVPGGIAYATPRGLYILRRDRVSNQLSAQLDRLFRFDGFAPASVAYMPQEGEIMVVTSVEGQRSLRYSMTTNRWCRDSARRALDVASSQRGEVAWLLTDARVRILDRDEITDGDDDLAFIWETPTIRGTPDVSTQYNLQALLVHVYLLDGPADLDISVVNVVDSSITVLATQTFSTVGPEKRATPNIGLLTSGHRVRFEQPVGDEGKIAIVEVDSQIQVDETATIASTVTLL